MYYKWLNKVHNQNLILFMNGWGMDENIVSNLNFENFDILMVYDYRSFDDKLDFDFSEYNKKYLIAWSMGVYISGLYSDVLNKFDKKIALCGTSKIIDDEFGILKKVYKLTIEKFNDKSAEKFIKSMFLNSNINIEISKTTKELLNELISIQQIEISNAVIYDKAVIPKFDKIIPYKNQLNFWSNTSAQLVELNAPHYIFDKYKTWQDLLC